MRASKGVTRFKSSAADGRKRYADWAGLVGSGLLGGGCGAEKKLAKRVNGSLGNGEFARGVRRVLAAWDFSSSALVFCPAAKNRRRNPPMYPPVGDGSRKCVGRVRD